MNLQELKDLAASLRAAGREPQAMALGPDILRAHFFAEQGREHPYAAPRTFTEKLYRRMLDVHEHGCPLYSRLSDKLQARDYAAARIGEQHLTPVLWSGDDPLEIPWHSLAPECVLKCNEGSGKGLLVLGPREQAEAPALAARWLAESYYWRRREFHYWPVPRRLMIEPRLDDGHPDGPIDYIFFCFDGVPRLLQVGSRSHTIHRFFTTAWEPVTLTYRKEYTAPPLERPAMLEKMLEMAATLSAGFDFVRVDLYCCGRDIRFGELTFTPCAGKVLFDPPHWDERLGEWWRYAGLPNA
jgi:hypothetical protein